jgi:hypothetical protein
MYKIENGKVKKVVLEGTGRKDASDSKWRYKPGDAIKYQVCMWHNVASRGVVLCSVVLV